MKRILLVIMIIMLAGVTACTSALSHGDQSSDSTHAFTVLSTQIIDKIDEAIASEGEVFLVIKYEIENLQSQNDSHQQWTDQITVETDGDRYEPTLIDTLDGQLWATSLLMNEAKTGYLVYTMPDDIHDFKLKFTLPISETEVAYEFRPVDKRISINADYVLMRLAQIARTERIAVIGGLLNAVSSSPIRYLGTILVPEEEIPQLLEQTEGLSEDAKRQVIEDYLIAKGHCRLE